MVRIFSVLPIKQLSLRRAKSPLVKWRERLGGTAKGGYAFVRTFLLFPDLWRQKAVKLRVAVVFIVPGNRRDKPGAVPGAADVHCRILKSLGFLRVLGGRIWIIGHDVNSFQQ